LMCEASGRNRNESDDTCVAISSAGAVRGRGHPQGEHGSTKTGLVFLASPVKRVQPYPCRGSGRKRDVTRDSGLDELEGRPLDLLMPSDCKLGTRIHPRPRRSLVGIGRGGFWAAVALPGGLHDADSSCFMLSPTTPIKRRVRKTSRQGFRAVLVGDRDDCERQGGRRCHRRPFESPNRDKRSCRKIADDLLLGAGRRR